MAWAAMVGRAGRRAAVTMTQQYLAGELSVLLAGLQAAATDEVAAGEAAHLRREAETRPWSALSGVGVRALDLADGMCWACLVRGDPTTFDRLAVIGARLLEFGVCSGLLHEGRREARAGPGTASCGKGLGNDR